MLRLKALLTLALVITCFVLLSGCGFFNEKAAEAEPATELPELPRWLQLSHRQSGILNFDFVPLNFEEAEAEAGDTGESTVKPAPRPNPTGSPYAPGTLDDMIWQQNQKNRRD